MSNTLNKYAGVSPTVTITSGTQLIVAIIVKADDGGLSATGCTIGGIAGTLIGRTEYTGFSESNFSIFEFTTIPAPGSHAVVNSGGGSSYQTLTYIYEFDDLTSVVPGSFSSQDFGMKTSASNTINYDVSGSTGATALVIAAASDSNDFLSSPNPTIPAALDRISDTYTLVRLAVATGVDSVVAGNPETYSFDFVDSTFSTQTGRFTAGSVLLQAASSTLTCDSITAGTIRAGDTVTIQLSNATNASGKTLSIPQGSITPSAQDINSISFIAPDLKTFGDKTGDYSTNITITVTDGAESDTIDFQIAPDVGDEVGAITALEGIYAEPEFSGVAVTDLYYTATISGADFTVGAVPVLETEQTFNLWIQDQTDGAWGSPFAVTIPASTSTFNTYEEFMDSLTGNGWTDKLILFLQGKGFTGGLTEAMYEYLKTKSSKLSHSERYQEWKDGGWG